MTKKRLIVKIIDEETGQTVLMVDGKLPDVFGFAIGMIAVYNAEIKKEKKDDE